MISDAGPEGCAVVWREVGVGMTAELVVAGDGPGDGSSSSTVGSKPESSKPSSYNSSSVPASSSICSVILQGEIVLFRKFIKI